MTEEIEISEAAKAKAAELANAVERSKGRKDDPWTANCYGYGTFDALARFIQQVSDAAKTEQARCPHGSALDPFILPEPVDPLLGVVEEAIAGTPQKGAAQLRAVLAKRGLKIVGEKSDG